MNSQLGVSPFQLANFSKNWAWFFIWGIVLVLLGVLAISATTWTTLFSVVFLGFVLLGSGIVILINSFTFWWGKWGGFFLHLIMGFLYAAVGILLIKSPILASVSLTWFLGIFYTVLGVFRIGYSLSVHGPQWGWNFFNGIITLILGILIMASWPASSLYIIGLFVGIDLLFCGWAYIMAALSARTLTQ